jgi:formylglycine-generating enzyme required for sulfatase activity
LASFWKKAEIGRMVRSSDKRPRSVPSRMVRLRGGITRVGTDHPILLQDDEGPSRQVRLKPFSIDPFAVTNGWFREFVNATGYQSDAERFGWSAVFFTFLPDHLHKTAGAAGAPWWRKTEGASWNYPEGPGSSIENRLDHPVVHISHHDAQAFAAWAGGRLPTEAEWEYAARGGREAATYPWGDREPDDTSFQPCNIWQGAFPNQNLALDGFLGTAPVGAFAPNGYGLHNMVGNTWEWCADSFRIRSLSRGARERNSTARAARERVMKGGSYLCHRSYCHRYRIAARSGAAPDTSTGHLGFRLVFDLA